MWLGNQNIWIPVPVITYCATLDKTCLSCLTESSSSYVLESHEIMMLTYAWILPIILGAQPWFKAVLDKILSLVHPWITFLSCCNLKEHLLFYFFASQAANIFLQFRLPFPILSLIAVFIVVYFDCFYFHSILYRRTNFCLDEWISWEK